MRNTSGLREGKERGAASRAGLHEEERHLGGSRSEFDLGSSGRWRHLLKLEDLAKWDRALRDHTLLSRAGNAAGVHASAKFRVGSKTDDGESAEYGFGWFLDPYKGRQRTWHSGTTTGFRTFIERFVDEELTIIILCNRDDLKPGKLAEQVADLYRVQ